MSIEEALRETADKRSSLQDIFRHIAPIYDLMILLISFGLIRSWRTCAARSLALKTGEIGLDLGTGAADLAIALSRASDLHAHIIGIDITPEMLEQGQLKLLKLGLQDRIELRRGDVEHLDLRDNSIDSCCSAFLIRNRVDRRQGFREMLRVVRPNGRMACLEVSHPSNKIFRGLFYFYFYRCAPICGFFLGQGFKAYQYLPSSLKDFPDASTLKKTMEECGWSDVHYKCLHGGMVAIHIGTKR
jgi:demethylmenaquinone methyltransferase/2-methoxy-6-polyprenyl-1,4-benzoquinol methylase